MSGNHRPTTFQMLGNFPGAEIGLYLDGKPGRISSGVINSAIIAAAGWDQENSY